MSMTDTNKMTTRDAEMRMIREQEIEFFSMQQPISKNELSALKLLMISVAKQLDISYGLIVAGITAEFRVNGIEKLRIMDYGLVIKSLVDCLDTRVLN